MQNIQLAGLILQVYIYNSEQIIYQIFMHSRSKIIIRQQINVVIFFKLVLCVWCEVNWSCFSGQEVRFATTGSDTFTLTVREGQHVVVDNGKRGIPPQQGSSWSDVQSCQLRGHVHRWIQTINKAGFNEYCPRVFNEFSADEADELILCLASGFAVVKVWNLFCFAA